MQTVVFDGRVGASGDMLLGALVAAGAEPAVLSPVTEALEVEYEFEERMETGIAATDATVLADHHARADDPTGEHSHSHEDSHSHGTETDHSHSHDATAEGTGPARSYAEVVELLEAMGLDPAIESDALAIFERLGRAEAAVHGSTLEDTQFHEVGADDAIADVVGSALLIADLDPETVLTTPVAVGGGEATFSHGTYPVPTPAVTEIAEQADWEIQGGPLESELLTPTGAAILAEFATGVETIPPIEVTDSGYGAGSRDTGQRPNVLRALRGRTDGAFEREKIVVLETNLDDAPPELLGGLHDSLAEVGARDVSITPLTMKKSRPGHLVSVVVRPADAERVAHRLAEETGTLGIREVPRVHRWVASRELRTATLEIDGCSYDVDVKLASDSESCFDVSAEYDDAEAVARETGKPVRAIMRQAEDAVRPSQ